ncbi:MAG: hypothetical protein ACRCST_15595 [Turicibacter sp.]
MNRIYYPYWEWEDFINGMYETKIKHDRVELCKKLLSSSNLYDAMKRVVNEWPISSNQNLMGNTNNKQSWLGQSACCLIHSANEIEVREAWSKLTDNQRIEANKIADKIIHETENIRLYQNLGIQRLF